MTADCLLDANVLVYAVDSSPENASKQAAAQRLLAGADFGLSAQVLQEFYVTATRKLPTPLSTKEATEFLEHLSAFPIVLTDYGLITEGIRNSIKYQMSYWDGTVLAAAERLKARVLYSEDLNDGQIYGTLQVINPFAG